MIFFLASLPEEEYVIVKDIFDHCELKDQKLSRSQRGSLINSKLDCKGVNFKPLRGVAAQTRKELLVKVRDGDLSFSELSRSCKYVKNMADVKKQFMKYMSISSWEQAEEKYPKHTKKEKLEPFLGMSFKNDTMPTLFLAYCKQAKCSTFLEGSASAYHNSSDDVSVLQVGKSAAIILRCNILELEDKDMMSSTSAHSCNGFSLSIVDPPPVS